MNLKKIFSEKISKQVVSELALKISSDKKKFNELMSLAISDGREISMRASWTAIHTCALNKKFLEPWIGKMIGYIQKPNNTSVKRNLIRILEETTIPEEHQALLFDTGLKILCSVNEAVATKAFTMTVLEFIVKQNPELKREFMLVLSDLIKKDSSPAIQSRGKKVSKSISGL